MPLLVLWTTTMALIGGMVSAQLQLDIGYGFYRNPAQGSTGCQRRDRIGEGGWCSVSPLRWWPVTSACGWCPTRKACPANTTASVVSSITVVILIDAAFAIATRGIGLPKL